MKKKLVVILLTVIMTVCTVFAFTACGGDTDIPDPDDGKHETPVVHEGYWTDKKEYSKGETITIHLDNTEIMTVRLRNTTTNPYTGGDMKSIGMTLSITSYMGDISSYVITGYLYMTDGFNIFTDIWGSGDADLCKQGVATTVGMTLRSKAGALVDTGKKFKLVICIPNTPTPLASYTNITMNID